MPRLAKKNVLIAWELRPGDSCHLIQLVCTSYLQSPLSLLSREPFPSPCLFKTHPLSGILFFGRLAPCVSRLQLLIVYIHQDNLVLGARRLIIHVGGSDVSLMLTP